MWDVGDVGCLGGGMWDVGDVGCLGGGMWDVGCLPGCGMLIYKTPCEIYEKIMIILKFELFLNTSI